MTTYNYIITIIITILTTTLHKHKLLNMHVYEISYCILSTHTSYTFQINTT